MIWVLRILLALLGMFVLWVALLTLAACLVNPKKDYDTDSTFYRCLLNRTTWWVLRVSRIRLHTEGLERLPTFGRFLLVSNHRSNFDPLIAWYVLRRYRVSFISKPDNFKLPWFGRIIRRCCFLPIQRDDMTESMITLHRAAELMKDDVVSMGVYPEGTRSKQVEMLPFHPVVFYAAQRAKVPVVVAVIEGTEIVHEHFPLRPTDVSFRILETIPPAEVCAASMKELSDRVRQEIEQVWH